MSTQYDWHTIFTTTNYNDLGIGRSGNCFGSFDPFFFENHIGDRSTKNSVGSSLTLCINSLSFCFLLGFFQSGTTYSKSFLLLDSAFARFLLVMARGKCYVSYQYCVELNVLIFNDFLSFLINLILNGVSFSGIQLFWCISAYYRHF